MKFEPIKPAPPVTRIFNDLSLVFAGVTCSSLRASLNLFLEEVHRRAFGTGQLPPLVCSPKMNLFLELVDDKVFNPARSGRRILGTRNRRRLSSFRFLGKRQLVGSALGNKVRGAPQGIERSGVRPPAFEDAVGQGPFFQVLIVDVGNFKFTSA